MSFDKTQNTPLGSLYLERYEVHTHYIYFRTRVHGVPFHITRWFEDIDLQALRNDLKQMFDRVVCHIYAYEITRYLTLGQVHTVDFGCLHQYVDSPFIEYIRWLWSSLIDAQWSYEHEVSFVLPKIPPGTKKHYPPFSNERPSSCHDKSLVLCGGGKDTLLCCRLLEEIGIEYGLYHESINAYGTHLSQQNVIKHFYEKCKLKGRLHNHYVMDDFYDSPASQYLKELDSAPHLGALRAGGEVHGSPGSGGEFSVLLTMFAYQYNHLIVAFEKSANIPSVDGHEELNHQIEKSEKHFRHTTNYIREHLWSSFDSFSILCLLYDTHIFNALDLLAKNQVHYTSSCNMAKPWCKKCAKCAYVWLGFRTYCWTEALSDSFNHENLLDTPELFEFWHEMLGLREHNALECVGSIKEIQLMFYLLMQEGVSGKAMNLYKKEVYPSIKNQIKKIMAEKTQLYDRPAKIILSKPHTTKFHQLCESIFRHTVNALKTDIILKQPKNQMT